MELLELYHLIELPAEVILRLEAVKEKINMEQVEPCMNQLMHMETAVSAYQCLKSYLSDDADKFAMLFYQLECARRIYDKYQEKHIPDKVFADTMKCFTRFLRECEKKTGKLFFDRGWWTYRQISMNLFRIGALEYQFQEMDGEKVIALHIPSDADFSEKSVDDSLAQAKFFLETYYPDYAYRKFTCNSWLLSPELGLLLSKKSNIRSFQRRFCIVGENREDKEYIEWLFQVPRDTEYEKLPEKTQLQKRVKDLLLAGGSIGSARGIMEQ